MNQNEIVALKQALELSHSHVEALSGVLQQMVENVHPKLVDNAVIVLFNVRTQQEKIKEILNDYCS